MPSSRDQLFQIPTRVKAFRNDCRHQNKMYFPSMFTPLFDLQDEQIDALHRIAVNFLQMEALLHRGLLIVQEELKKRPKSLILNQLNSIEEDMYEIAVLLRTRVIQQQTPEAARRNDSRWGETRKGMQIKMAVGKALSFTTVRDLRIVKTSYGRSLLWLAAVRKLEFESARPPHPSSTEPRNHARSRVDYQPRARPSIQAVRPRLYLRE